ncbi:MAG: DMT family transporter [Lachnospiraceae bacterium]|nr:DMT family transporter [Lachnospiraceae bacterium]
MVGFLIAILSGALMSVQGVFNTQVTKTAGMWLAAAFVQFTALVVCVAAWLIKERTPVTSLFLVQPKYMLLGGVIGAFITITVIKAMEFLGPAKAVMFIVVSQLLVAYVIELFGMFGVEKQPLEWRRVIGMAIAIAGVILFKW